MSSCVLQYTHINAVNLPLDIIALVTILPYITLRGGNITPLGNIT